MDPTSIVTPGRAWRKATTASTHLASGTPITAASRTAGAEVRTSWAAHDVRYHRTGTKDFHHPFVGDLTLDFEAFELPGDEGERLNVYIAPPDTASEEALNLLASWTVHDPIRNPTEVAETTAATITTEDN